MILKQCLLVLLAVFLVIGCVGAVSAEDTPITSVDISGITIPVAGSAPFTGTPTFTTDSPNNATSNSVSWVTSDGTSVSGNFAYSTVYKAEFTLTAATDCNFTGTDFSYTGEGTADITVDSDKKTAEIVITFEATGTDPKTNIESITISAITPPVANTEPVTTNPTFASLNPSDSVISPSTITWKTSSGTAVSGNFTYDTIYKAEFMVSAATNYRLTSSTYVASNGGTSTIVPNADGTAANITITYPKTEPAPVTTVNITSLSVTGLTEPAFGATPDTSVSVSGGGESPTVSWSPTASTFADNTTYTATITIQNASGYVFTAAKPTVSLNGDSVSSTYVTVNPSTQLLTISHTFPSTAAKILPTITLSANVTSGTVSLPVKFTYNITNATSKSWTYGDGSSATISSNGTLTHTYTTVGTYTANLTATNANGTVYKTVVITVNKVGLDASFTASSESGTMPLTVLFVDKSVGSPTQWVWDFGGVGSSALQNPSYTFTSAGTYIVKLTIVDSTGATDSYSRAIYVNAPAATSTPTATPTTASLTAISIGEVSVPAPLDIIKEFMHLFYSLLDPTNYLFIVNES